MKAIFFTFVTIFVSLNVLADGKIETGIDPLYSASTELRVTGTTAYIIAVSMLRASGGESSSITLKNGLISGENFACREVDSKNHAYACAAKFNYERKGELRPLDPGGF